MEQVAVKINVQGSIFNLKVKGKPLKLPKWDGVNGYKPSSVRSTATAVGCDNNRKYKVSVIGKEISITRLK